MTKIYSIFIKTFCLLVALCTFTVSNAQSWVKKFDLTGANAVFVGAGGNIIASNYYYDYEGNDIVYLGGIYYSQDQGETWTKCDVRDFNYSRFFQVDDYIFALGEGCNIARSKDDGITWEILNYAYALKGIVDDKALEYGIAYASVYHNKRLYIGDGNGGGVLYSEDYGETWQLTDRESLKFNLYGDEVLDTYYDMAVNNDEILLFGVYMIYRYDIENDKWILLRNDSNFMGVPVTYGNKLICGRGIINYDMNASFLEYTEDGGRTWGTLPRPEGEANNAIRTTATDQVNLYVGIQMGEMYYTKDLGENWTIISDGLPYTVNPEHGTKVYEHVVSLDLDSDYLYVAVYDEPWSGSTLSGVYRYKISELPQASVGTITNDAHKVFFNDNNLCLARPANIAIYNITGALVSASNNCNCLNLDNLANGVYIYEICDANTRTTGKFIKK